MTQATPTRNQEIKTIHIQYEDFYRIGGGLVVIIVLILIGSWVFGENSMGFADTMLGYITNVATEGLSVVATIIVIDQLNHRREREERKQALFRQAKSRSNDFAVDALSQIQDEGWWDEFLEYYPSHDRDYRIDLSRVQWAGGVQLQEVNLQQADLRGANLQQANLFIANLQQADLRGVNLQQANLWGTNLSGADLWSSNLQQAFLMGANLSGADLWSSNLQQADLWSVNLQGADLESSNLSGANLEIANLQGASLGGANLEGAILSDDTGFDEKTVLPDAEKISTDDNGNDLYDKYWTPETDMSRYTDPDHPDFWQHPRHAPNKTNE